MRRGFLALLGLLVAYGWSAQQITVKDLVSNAPIEGAVIFSEARTAFLKSDSKGRVDITALLPCDSILITHVAYESQAVSTSLLKRSPFTVTMMPTVIQMPTFELKAARESFFESPKQMVTLSEKAMETTQPRTTADLLERSGEVFVQRSQLGGGSPVLRGFEANRILLMVDGVRLNNAIYRSGHLQNAITVDPYLLERTEVIFGPGSLIYGSDALGGVIHFRSRRPKTLPYSRKKTSLRFAQKMSTATEESASHLDFEYSGDRLASLSSFTLTRFGKLRMGENRLHGDAEWG
ncbi:MAG: TonB-dependent receptor plug domain-containing protein, partial [Flavobacteriales bacterium]|nr:TonB-dependent receptor plug domain-containing protein [Flavobacteriales bacterium]